MHNIEWGSNMILFFLRTRLLICLDELLLGLRENWCMILYRQTVSSAECVERRRGTDLIFHAELALALGLPAQLARIAKHVIESDFSSDGEFVISDFAI